MSSIDATHTKLRWIEDAYRTRESSLSSQNSDQSSNNRPCYYESKCYKQDCSLRHPLSRRVCEDEIQCDDYQCTANHPPGRPSSCSEGNTCLNPNCRLLHPKRLFVECINGVDCCRFECRALHPSTRPIPCQYGKQCYNTMCLCLHPLDRQLCIRGVECTEFECECIHPLGRSVNCKDGLNCDNIYCSRLHPLKWNPKDEDHTVQAQQLMMSTKQQNEHKLKSFNQRMIERSEIQLPIFASRIDFCQRLMTEKLLVVTAETGSGKSTQLPQYAAEHFHDGIVVCTQPRVVAAISLARRVADEYDGSSEGYSVGYQVGSRNGKNMCVQGTRIMFMTDAALIRESQLDPNLSKVRVLIIDEAHERSLNTDIVLGIAKLILNKRPNDFSVVISSATIDPTGFLQFFDRPLNRPLTVPGRLYDVTEEYLPPPNDCNEQIFIEKHIIPTVIRLFPKHLGHTLVFLHGQREIEKALALFSRNMPKGCVALPLYGSMSPEEQDEVLKFNNKDSQQRMVVFCTNVAETSLTIQNVQLVIDSGLVKEARFDTKRRLTIIETTQISRSSAKQRKGRAGRTTTGHCVRLYNETDLTRDNIQPEILRSSLDLVILQIVRLGHHPETFPFIDQPDSIVLRGSLDLLTRLSCINETSLTTRGHLFAELALDPRLSALMTEMYTDIGGEHLLTLTATIVAILSAPGSLFFVGGATKEAKDEARTRIAIGAHEHDSDLFYLCAIYNRWKQAGSIDRLTNTCSTCHKTVLKRFDACRSCRVQHSNTNRLNNKILQIVDSSSESYVKTIMSPRWKLTPYVSISAIENERDLIGEHLYKLFPEQLGHLLVRHLPDNGVRLISTNIRARIVNTSVFVQRLHEHGYQHFVSMSITQLPAGDYLVDRLHPVPYQCVGSVPTIIIFSADKIGWLVNCEMRRKFNECRLEPWCNWLVYEYNQITCQLNVWGMNSDELMVKPILNSMLDDVCSMLLNKTQSLDYGPIRASFKSGFLCTSIEKMNKTLRLDLQHVPCATIDELHQWLRTKLSIGRQDILENNFRIRRRHDRTNDDAVTYEAPPFYMVLKSADVFEKASILIPQYYVCPQNSVSSSSTTGTYMGEKDAWGRQLMITLVPGSRILSPEEVTQTLYPYIVNCREYGKKIRARQPGFHLSNLPLNTTESFIRQALRPIIPTAIYLRTSTTDGTGSASANIFFFDEQQCQQACTILQRDLCEKIFTITIRTKRQGRLVSKYVRTQISNIREKPQPAQTFLVTTTNRDVALKLFKEIIPNQGPTWRVDAAAIVTVLQPDIYPNFNQLVQSICQKFGTNVQQQVVEQKHHHDVISGGIRCIFNHAPPPKTASAAAMLAQITSPLVIKTSDHRQKCLFDELFEQGLIQKWSHDLNLSLVEKKSKWNSSIEIKGPQIQKGQLLRQIADYSDEFDCRFRIYDLSIKVANFFGRQKAASAKLDQIAEKWASQGCHVTYLYKTKSIAIHGLPKTTSTDIDECEKEVKQMLSVLIVHNDDDEDNRRCSFCGRKSTSTKRLRLCGHSYCRCASSLLAQTFPLQCLEANCKTNIHIYDLQEIYDSEEFSQICKRSLQNFLMANSLVDDRVFCPNEKCDGLINKSGVYQTCIICGERVCALCRIINDDLHEGRTCDQRVKIINEMGEFLPRLFYAGEKYVRENWTPDLPRIIHIERNMHLVEECLSLQRFYKGVTSLGDHPPPDLARGVFAFHGTDTKSILPICTDGFNPHLRKGQAYGIGEYFGITAGISDGYCRNSTGNGVKTMVIAFIVRCHQVSTKAGFCHVVNNPIDWSYAYNLPVLVVSYGSQASAPLILTNPVPPTVQNVSPVTLQSIAPSTVQTVLSPSPPQKKQSNSKCLVA